MCSQRRGEDHQPSSFGHTRASCTACGDCRRTEMPRVRPRVRPRALPWCVLRPPADEVPRCGLVACNALPAGDTRVLVRASSVLDNRRPRADQHSSPSPPGSAGKRGRPPAAAQQPRLPATNLSGFCLSLCALSHASACYHSPTERHPTAALQQSRRVGLPWHLRSLEAQAMTMR